MGRLEEKNHSRTFGLEWTNSHQCTSWGWGNSSCFGDEPKTYPFPLPMDFSAPCSLPKFSPPTSLTSFPTHAISRAQESSRAWIGQSFKEMWATRLEEGGELNVEGTWKGESKNSASCQMRKWEKKGKLLPFSIFLFLYGFFPLCFFFFSSASEEDAIVFFFHFLFLFEAKKVMTQVCRCLFFSSIFFVVNKATITSLMSS